MRMKYRVVNVSAMINVTIIYFTLVYCTSAMTVCISYYEWHYLCSYCDCYYLLLKKRNIIESVAEDKPNYW